MAKQQLFLRVDKSSPKKRNIENEVLTSWVLDAIRKVFGLQDIRQDILKHFVPQKYHKIIEFGNTFGSESNPHELKKYLESLLHVKKRLVLFTASNFAQDGETHYQTFVLDQTYKHLWVIDPASEMGEMGIYKPFIAMNVIIPFFSMNGYITEFAKLKHACQTSVDDIFCQTWSLLLQIHFVRRYLQYNDLNIILPVSQSIRQRYKYLVAFYRESLRSIDSICSDLQEIYYREVSKSKYLVIGVKDVQQRKLIRNQYKAIDPCKELLKMNEIDLMVDEQLQQV